MCGTCRGEGRLVCTDQSSSLDFKRFAVNSLVRNTCYTSEFEAVHYAKRLVEDLISLLARFAGISESSDMPDRPLNSFEM